MAQAAPGLFLWAAGVMGTFWLLSFRLPLAKLMDELNGEMVALSANARRERMPEFDSRVIALMKRQDELGKAARVFLQQSANPKGNA